MSYRDRRDNVPLDCKVYVGNLGNGASRNTLENEFGYYGRLVNVWVARNPPGFAYVEFEDKHDARDAVRGMDGKWLCGRRAKVELSHGMPRQRSSSSRSSSNYGGAPARRSMSDIRCYTCNGRGHYARDCPRGHRSRSRSPRRRSYSRSRSRGRSASRSRSRSKSRSRSPAHKRSKSRSRSRSKSRSRSPAQKRSKSRSRSVSPKREKSSVEPETNGCRNGKSKSRSASRSRSRS